MKPPHKLFPLPIQVSLLMCIIVIKSFSCFFFFFIFFPVWLYKNVLTGMLWCAGELKEEGHWDTGTLDRLVRKTDCCLHWGEACFISNKEKDLNQTFMGNHQPLIQHRTSVQWQTTWSVDMLRKCSPSRIFNSAKKWRGKNDYCEKLRLFTICYMQYLVFCAIRLHQYSDNDYFNVCLS